MILKSHDLDKWVAKYFVSKMKHIEILKKRRKDTEKCTIQYLFSMSVSFLYHFSIFSVSEFFIGCYCKKCNGALVDPRTKLKHTSKYQSSIAGPSRAVAEPSGAEPFGVNQHQYILKVMI